MTYLLAKWAVALHLLPRVTFPFVKGTDTHAQESQMLRYRHCVVEGWRAEFPDLFLKYRPEITDLFSFDRKISDKVNKWMSDNYGGGVRLGVHIRRGDYARWYDGRFFYTDDVFSSFICSFVEACGGRDVSIYISSNDSSVTVESFRRLCGKEEIYMMAGNAAEDLCMLSLCDYIIGPPSTYSLVASMYNDVPLLWMESADGNASLGNFKRFAELFTNIY